MFYAHSLPGKPVGEWQPLEEHLAGVAKLARCFAEPFGGEEWAELAGRWHDVGKGTRPWQAYLRHANGIRDEFLKDYQGHPAHSQQGAQRLFHASAQAGKLLAYCCAGHHAGLPNWHDTSQAALEERLSEVQADVEAYVSEPVLPERLPLKVQSSERFGFQLQFFVRMIFSCLVDADYLDTERALDVDRASERNRFVKLDVLHSRFQEALTKLQSRATAAAFVNRYRNSVLQDCLNRAHDTPGLFSLTVPTGGGKTLSSMAFALAHAKRHGKRRIIYVIPFTSIIEQNASVFRDVFGDDAVLEHHCNFIPEDSDWMARLAMENWDAPIVVTTNVQLFDSFYSNKTSKTRRLHNVAESVIVFDEVQAIPVDKLHPCIEVIRELTLNYGVSCVLCTATQPALNASDIACGLRRIREIVAEPEALFKALKRTTEVSIGERTAPEVAQEMAGREQVLCIVNSRRQALDVFAALPRAEANIHLSALMYPAHRSRVLRKIRERLRVGRPCRVVSTQLIEAGVDVDFPCVYRASAGIDSIAQAAGRCNRNGLSSEPRDVFVFSFPADRRCDFVRQASQSAEKLFPRFNGCLTSPDCVREFFADYFWKREQRMDADGIVAACMEGLRGDIQFKTIAAFQMIESTTVPVLVAVEEDAVALVRELRFAKWRRGLFRKLQRYTVQVYPYQVDELRQWLEEPATGLLVLFSSELYCNDTGLQCTSPRGVGFFA